MRFFGWIMLSLAFLIGTYSCKIWSNSQSTSFVSAKTMPLLVEYTSEVYQNDNFNAKISNASQDTLKIIDPVLKRMEKKERDRWRKIRIQYCPCGANCEPPPRYKVFLPGMVHEIHWNLMESWCGKEKQNGFPEPFEKKVSTGKYRFSVQFLDHEKQENTLIQEFTITDEQ